MRKTTALLLSMGAGAGLAATLRRDARAQSDFFAVPASRQDVDVGSGTIDIPLRYHRTDAFAAVFAADFASVRQILPSPQLRPVRLLGGGAAVTVAAYLYWSSTIGSYGEIVIAPLVTQARRAPPLLPLLAEAVWPYGAYVWRMPVTTRLTRDAGRTVWGYPKFVADMDFERSPEQYGVRLEEDGQQILTLNVRRRGLLVPDNRPTITYTAREGRLVKTVLPKRAAAQVAVGSGGATLQMGPHSVGEDLRRLGVSGTPQMAKSWLGLQMLLPEGEVIGRATGSTEGYLGRSREQGRLTIRYQSTGEPIPLHRSSSKQKPLTQNRAIDV